MLRRKKYVFYLFQFFDAIFLVTIQFQKNESVYKEEKTLQEVFLCALLLVAAVMTNYLLNVNYIVSTLCLHTFGIFMIVVFLLHPTLSEVSIKLVLYIVIATGSVIGLYYLDENRQRLSYLDKLKIKRLLKEQKIIFEDLPDGLMIHQQEDK